MFALHVSGSVEYDLGLVGASLLIAVVAATVAVFFSVKLRGWRAIVIAASVMGVAVVGMHYTAMAALRVRLSVVPEPPRGVTPVLLIVPITILTAAALVGTALSALQAMTEEEFAGAGPVPPLPVRYTGTHAETPWTLRTGKPAPAELVSTNQPG
jgi:hypothetical protein